MPGGRRAHVVDADLDGRVPRVRREGRGGVHHRRGRPPILGFVPGRHGGPVRPCPSGHRGGHRPADADARHHDHASHGRQPLGRPGTPAALRPAVLAGPHDRNGRQPHGVEGRPVLHRAPARPRLQRDLPRIRGRDPRGEFLRRAHQRAGYARPDRSGCDEDDPGHRFQRRRGPGKGPGARGRRLRHHRARHDQQASSIRNRASTRPCGSSPAGPGPCSSSTRPTLCAPVPGASQENGGSRRTSSWRANSSPEATLRRFWD